MAPPSLRNVKRFARAALIIVLVFILLPYVITPAYLFVRPASTPMMWRWVTGEQVTRAWLPLEAIAPALPYSVIAAEDARYCVHYGVDWQELREVLEEVDDISELRGGSTISQQTAKNLFLWPGRSFVRKALEFPLALWLDLVLGKRRLMEVYLNVAQWGPNGEFGVEAGARRAFGKSARALSSYEAALLAAVLPNPHRRNAQRPGPGLRRLAGLYQARARDAAATNDCLGRRGP
jgi:monofunctional biosynthetic peptidoglycan transglycosylase